MQVFENDKGSYSLVFFTINENNRKRKENSSNIHSEDERKEAHNEIVYLERAKLFQTHTY